VNHEDHLAETVRIERRRVLATLIRTVGDLQVAEDAVQEAAIAALRTWPTTGVPANPRAWLTVTARRKAVDVLRREAARPAKELAATLADPVAAGDVAGADGGAGAREADMLEPETAVRDDLLRLLFTCCHPALGRDAQVALALRTLAGLDVAAIAHAFLVPEATMAKRLVRARQKITHARIPYRVPSDAELPERLPGVLAVVYLIATEAHAPSSGTDVARADIEAVALDLARLLVELMPGEPEVLSLLALLLFTAARRPARADEDGAAVLLADQDRSRWDHLTIAEASARLHEAVQWSKGVAGPYQLQAHLAACHTTAPRWSDTDWDRIVTLYDLFLQLSANPVISLNRAIAVAERDGPGAGLAALDSITGTFRSHLFHAARAEMLGRLGARQEAAAELRLAIDLAGAEPDRRLLQGRLARLSDG
jgi:RNA polymerase sigma-70 factor (ECF subfamily)